MTILTIILFFILVALIVYIMLKQRREKKMPHSPYNDALTAVIDGKIDTAIRKLKETVQTNTDNIDAYLRLGDLYRKKNEINKAIQIHQTLTLRPTITKEEEKRIYFSLAQDYLADKRFTRATSFLKEILKIDKDNNEANEMILNIYEENENYLDAALIEEELAKKKKDFLRLATYYAEHGQRLLPSNEKEGLGYLKKALKRAPKCPNALYYMGEYCAGQGKADKAVEWWGKLLEVAPNYSFLVLDKLEKAYYDLGRFDEVVSFYKNLFNKSPKNISVGLALSQIYVKKGDLIDAREVLNKIADVNPQSIVPQLQLAELALEEEDCDRAKDKLNRLLNTITIPKLLCARCGVEITGANFFCKKCFGPSEIVVRYQ